jgi:hypothetical protein
MAIKWKWTGYLAAALLAAYLLLSFGAPAGPIAVGVVLAGVWNFLQRGR